MALLPQDRQSQVMLLITIGMAALGYAFVTYWAQPTGQQIRETSRTIDSLQVIIDRAKQDLASGTVEDLRRKVEQYTALLAVMRRLVPDKNEVPALIDDISTKAKVRGVTIGRIEPFAPETGSPFDTYRYRLEIIGHYDQLGEFLSDIASLPRIIVPQDVLLKPAQQQAQRLLGDTLGSLLEAQFQIRTFVKAAAPPGVAPSPKRGGKPGAGEGGGGGGGGGGRRVSARLVACVLALLATGSLGAQAKPSPARDDTNKKVDSTAAPQLVREVYSYEGGGRDPFMSLLRSGDIRPLLSDLRLVGVYYDGRYPARSVAVLRDVTNNKVYRVKPGNIIGRLKATTIRPREVVFTVQEFGFERQESLQLAKQEVTP